MANSSPRPQLNPDRVLYGLIGANVAVYGLWQIVDTRFMKTHFTVCSPAARRAASDDFFAYSAAILPWEPGYVGV